MNDQNVAAFRERYGRWAVIAGASEGIGRAYAHALAARGLNLVLIARRAGLLEAQAQVIRDQHQVEARATSLDLGAPDLAQAYAAAVEGLDVGLLVYVACASSVADFNDTPLADLQRMLDVNCRGLVILAQQVAPRLVARGRGGLIVMASMAGLQGSALVSTYAATKAFDIVFAEGLWAELSPRGVDVLACIAGATSTPGFESVTPSPRRGKAFPMSAEQVAREGLAALGRRPVHITGRLNRWVNAFGRLMSRRGRTRFFSSATRSIYGPGAD